MARVGEFPLEFAVRVEAETPNVVSIFSEIRDLFGGFLMHDYL